jgi:hypothetical protein
MLEKKRRDDLHNTRKDSMIAFGINTFDEFYRDQLNVDAKKKPREIDQKDF